jgi:hypothetical protein
MGPEPSGEGSSNTICGADVADTGGGGGALPTERICVVARRASATPPTGGGVEAPVVRCPGRRVMSEKCSAPALAAQRKLLVLHCYAVVFVR